MHSRLTNSSTYGPVSSLLFRRVCRQHIEPLPPLCGRHGWHGEHRVPLFVLVIPFTMRDRLHYIEERNVAPDEPKFQDRITIALYHMEAQLPSDCRRFVALEDSDVAINVVIATNESKGHLEKAFDLDRLERIRRAMGVQWAPTWNRVPPGETIETLFGAENLPLGDDVEPESYHWPDDLPSLVPITWETTEQAPPDDCDLVEVMIRSLSEVQEEVLGIPDLPPPHPLSQLIVLED
jgi:hypothetical protein